MKRVAIHELLDSDAGTAEEIAASLRDLDRINRWFGGISTTESMLVHVAGQAGTTRLSALEVAAGRGGTPESVRKRLRHRGVEVDVTLLDRAQTHLAHSGNGEFKVAGDALALPFAGNSFDVVSSCLFVHHLAPCEVVKFVNEGLRVARVAVLINDLIRDPMHLGLVYAGTPLYRSRLTRHDAPASVRQAYTPQEMIDLVKQTNAVRAEVGKHFLFRMGVIAWKRA